MKISVHHELGAWNVDAIDEFCTADELARATLGEMDPTPSLCRGPTNFPCLRPIEEIINPGLLHNQSNLRFTPYATKLARFARLHALFVFPEDLAPARRATLVV